MVQLQMHLHFIVVITLLLTSPIFALSNDIYTPDMSTIDAANKEVASSKVEEACKKMLANLTVETFEFELFEI